MGASASLIGPVQINVADGNAVDGVLGTHFEFHFAGHAAGADSGIDAAALATFNGAGEHHAAVVGLKFDVQVAVALHVDARLVESAVVAVAVAIATAATAAAAEVEVAVVIPTAAVAPAVVPPASVAAVVAVVVTVIIPAAAIIVATVVVATAASAVESAAAATAPEDVKRVAFAASLVVFDSNHGSAAIVGTADQILSAATVDSLETEIVGSHRHFLIALEAAEGGRRAVEGTDGCVATGYFHFGDIVDFDFDGAFAVSAASADFSGATVGDALGPSAR